MPLTELDQQLLQRCLDRKPRAWEDFVDRFLGLVIHVINHTAQVRGAPLSAEDRDDLCAEVMLALIEDDLAVLRRFRGKSSLAAYLTVVARRIVVRHLFKRRRAMWRLPPSGREIEAVTISSKERPDRGAELHEEARWFLRQLREAESQVVQMHHIENKSYEEIGRSLGLPTNSVGPMLSRARSKMRHAAERRRFD